MRRVVSNKRFPAYLHNLPYRRIALEIVIVGAAIFLYFLVRGVIQERVEVAFSNADAIIRIENSLGLFIEPALQQRIIDNHAIVTVVNFIYIYGHWPVIIGTLFWLVARHRSEYVLFRDAILISGAIGLVFFVLFPVAPPRFLEEHGFIDTVTENTNAYRIFQPPALTNQYAAIPSLHFGWNLLIGIAWVTLAQSRLMRLLGWVMPMLMLGAIVLTANHFLLDGVLGGALALVGYVIASRRYSAQRISHPTTRSSVALAPSSAKNYAA